VCKSTVKISNFIIKNVTESDSLPQIEMQRVPSPVTSLFDAMCKGIIRWLVVVSVKDLCQPPDIGRGKENDGHLIMGGRPGNTRENGSGQVHHVCANLS
jgi:hypothetical protein